MPEHDPKVNIWFHERLNPNLWRHDALRPIVRLKFLKGAVAFYQFLEVQKLVIKDVIFTGSNAGYTYTPLSDLDLHLVADFASTDCPDLAIETATAKRVLWNQTHHITIYGHPVELYVQDVTKPLVANGVYSVLHRQWLKHPTPIIPRLDDTAITHKVNAYAEIIERVLDKNPSDINHLLLKLQRLRQTGLLRGGEFSVENLTYKALRAAGYLQRLHNARILQRDRSLSLSAS